VESESAEERFQRDFPEVAARGGGAAAQTSQPGRRLRELREQLNQSPLAGKAAGQEEDILTSDDSSSLSGTPEPRNEQQSGGAPVHAPFTRQTTGPHGSDNIDDAAKDGTDASSDELYLP
jgi:hypothetical protein